MQSCFIDTWSLHWLNSSEMFIPFTFEQVHVAKLGSWWPPTLAIGHGHGLPPYKKAIQIGQTKPTNTFVFPKQLGKKRNNRLAHTICSILNIFCRRYQ